MAIRSGKIVVNTKRLATAKGTRTPKTVKMCKPTSPQEPPQQLLESSDYTVNSLGRRSERHADARTNEA
jgi:hypothetical protein